MVPHYGVVRVGVDEAAVTVAFVGFVEDHGVAVGCAAKGADYIVKPLVWTTVSTRAAVLRLARHSTVSSNRLFAIGAPTAGCVLKTFGRALCRAVAAVQRLASFDTEVWLFLVTVSAHLRDHIAKNLVRPFQAASPTVDCLTRDGAVMRRFDLAVFASLRHYIAKTLLGRTLVSAAAAQRGFAGLHSIHRSLCLAVTATTRNYIRETLVRPLASARAAEHRRTRPSSVRGSRDSAILAPLTDYTPKTLVWVLAGAVAAELWPALHRAIRWYRKFAV